MKSLFVTAVMIVFTGCLDSGSDRDLASRSPDWAQASYQTNRSTIERYRAASGVIEAYTPGASTVGLYNQANDQVSTMPADPETVRRFLQGLRGLPSSVEGSDATLQDGGGGVSCSSRDGNKDCFCTGSCCRDETTCWCTGC